MVTAASRTWSSSSSSDTYATSRRALGTASSAGRSVTGLTSGRVGWQGSRHGDRRRAIVPPGAVASRASQTDRYMLGGPVAGPLPSGCGTLRPGRPRAGGDRVQVTRPFESRDHTMTKPVQVLDRVTIRFAGDSGDGMQLTGDRFTSETAAFGNDLSTLPDFPAEIRAPAGSIAGVSGFQLHFADHDILTTGDVPDVLVAMNPAALKANLGDLPKGASLIVNTDAFTARNLDKAGYAANPLEDGTLADYQVHEVALTSMTLEALKEFDISKKEAERAKNMFALGLMSWLYHRPTEATVAFLEKKFATRPLIAKANVTAFKAGWNFGETTEAFAVSYEVKPAKLQPGTYRTISGNLALAYGRVAASQLSGLPLFLGAYPITPASDILHELSKHKAFGVRTFQAEDEIAGVGAAL